MQPNILIIMCDQLTASVLGCYGGPVPTPHIDQLAASGVVFDNATCPFPVCSPSRASFVTGLYPHTHGIAHNVNRREYEHLYHAIPPTQEGLKVNDVTTESVLYNAGYQTHHYGKWHLLDDDLPYYTDLFGEHRQYAATMAAEFDAVRSQPRDTWMDWYGWALPVQTKPEIAAARSDELAGGPFEDFVAKMGRLDLPEERTFDAMAADRVIERLAAVGPQPFMVTCSFNYPHDPNVVPAAYYDKVDASRIELPPTFAQLEDRFANSISAQIGRALGPNGVKEFLRIYYASVMLVDDQVGRILQALDDTGRLDDTIVVFTADHGDMAGAHGMVWKSAPCFYDEIVQVPLIVTYTRQASPRRSAVAAGLVDVMPTLLELTGTPVPDGVQGRSLAPYLTGQADDADGPQFGFCERLERNPKHRRTPPPTHAEGYMVRGQGWKYIRYADGEEFLFNLHDDPGETDNLVGVAHVNDRKRGLAAVLDQWMSETNAPPLKPARQ